MIIAAGRTKHNAGEERRGLRIIHGVVVPHVARTFRFQPGTANQYPVGVGQRIGPGSVADELKRPAAARRTDH